MPNRMPVLEIKTALIDIIGTITAMAEQSLPNDLQRWAEGIAAQFVASFHAARSSFTAEDLELLQGVGEPLAARGTQS
jgi:hypothetical protein